MKSAYELAMERLNAENGPSRQLSGEEKEAIADIDRKFDARAAEAKLGFDERLAKAESYAELQTMRDQMASELKAIEEKREAEKDRVWVETLAEARPERRIGPSSRRAWIALAVFLCMLAAAAWLDRRLKSAPHPGFILPDAAWILYAPDWPQTWDAFEHAPEWAAMRDAFPTQLFDPRLQLRFQTGIRLTPARWRTWFGPSILLHGNGDHWGFVTRPGLLIRGADFLAGAPLESIPGARVWNKLHYAWRDGYLLASPSTTWLSETMRGEVYQSHDAPGTSPVLLAELRGATTARLTLQCENGAPIQGVASIPIGKATRPLNLPYMAEDPPLFYVEGASLKQLEDLRAGLGSRLFALVPSSLQEDLPAPFALLMEAWRRLAERESENQASFAFHNIGWLDGVPVPVAALIVDDPGATSAAHPFALEPGPWVEQPYRWENVTGSFVPLWGDGFALWRARQDPCWFAATHQELLGALLRGGAHPASNRSGGLYLAVSWSKLATVSAALLNAALENGLCTEWLDLGTKRALTPFIDAVGLLNNLELTVEGTAEGLRFDGFLNAPPPRAEETP